MARKSTKRSWRQVDTTHAEQSVDSARISHAADTSLFVIDTIGNAAPSKKTNSTKRTRSSSPIRSRFTEKKAKLGAIVARSSKHRKASTPNKPTASGAGAAAAAAAAGAPTVPAPALPLVYDLWAEPSSRSAAAGADPWTKVRPDPLRIRSAISLATDPIRRGFVAPGIAVCHPGASYHPSRDDREQAVRIAFQYHLDEVEHERVWDEKVAAARAATYDEELPSDDDDDSDDAGVLGEVGSGTTPSERVTRVQRNKQKRHVESLRLIKARQAGKQLAHQITLAKQLAPAAPVAKPAKDPTEPRLSRHGTTTACPDVLLADELSGNLRCMVSGGANAIKDQFLSMQRQGRIESRTKAKVTKHPSKLYNRYRHEQES